MAFDPRVMITRGKAHPAGTGDQRVSSVRMFFCLIGCLLILTRCESVPEPNDDDDGNHREDGTTTYFVPGYQPFYDGHRFGWYR